MQEARTVHGDWEKLLYVMGESFFKCNSEVAQVVSRTRSKGVARIGGEWTRREDGFQGRERGGNPKPLPRVAFDKTPNTEGGGVF